jgi:hypothetical protein
MIKVEDKLAYAHLFEEYTHNIPVIYSSLEGQYEGELFVDKVKNPQMAILFTPFDFHFVAGNAEISDVINLVDDTVFNQYLLKTDQKEAILFAPNQKWNTILDEVFKRHNGIKDKRLIFNLNKEKYQKHNNSREISSDSLSRLLLEKEQSSGFMLGKGHAEINIGTVEAFRGKGYAKDAAFTLINHLLKDDIEPDWCTWPYRVESQKLACSLGFELSEEVPVYIWVEDECGKIQ